MDEFPASATALAQAAVGLSEPNPRVGCVLVGARGEVLGTGHTQRAGGPHAEAAALRALADAGLNPRGATAYVTLEPCSHHGRTPPCCDALVAAGVAKVVVAIRDPNPVIFLENEVLYGHTGEVPKLDDYVIPIGKARIVRTGKDPTLISWSNGMT